MSTIKSKLTWMTLFAVAMALLEAAVVVYMRRLYYPDNPLDLFPLKFLLVYDPVLEVSREAATVLMIVAVAMLAGESSWTRRFAAFVLVFGVWDLFYYFWLKVLIGWPREWLEWDVLFLIPGVWLGPWICPAVIALLFTVWGAGTLMSARPVSFTLRSLLTFVVGACLGLVTFLQPAAVISMNGGIGQLSQYTPGRFWWWLFVPAYLLMVMGFAMTLRSNEAAQVSSE